MARIAYLCDCIFRAQVQRANSDSIEQQRGHTIPEDEGCSMEDREGGNKPYEEHMQTFIQKD
jgi:hypothetical protein